MRGRERHVGLGLLGAVALAGTWIGFHACLAPTQVRVDIHTLGLDCKLEVRAIAIGVGRTSDDAEAHMAAGNLAAETRACESSTYVGSLIVTPDGDSGAIIVAAQLGERLCRPPLYEGCVVARRRFSFARHASLTLPITLEGICRNVPCGPNDSCRGGVCVSAETDCRTNGKCEAPAEPPPIDGPTPGVDAGPDAPIAPRDNLCPTVNAGIDCGPAPSNCCKNLGEVRYECATSPAACPSPSPYYPCVGAKHCASNTYCCNTPPSVAPTGTASVSASTSVSATPPPPPPWSVCSAGPCNGGWICTTDSDCPPTMGCNGVLGGSGRGGKFLKTCTR